MTAADVLSAGRPGSRTATLNLLDGIARVLREEVLLADDDELAQRLTMLLADVFDCQDTIIESL